MLSFAYVTGLVGLGCSALVALLALANVPLAALAGVYHVSFAGVFLSFVPAILGHPARTASGGEVTVGMGQVVRTAARWTVVLAGAAVAAFVAAASAGWGDGFSITNGELAGRSDRQLALACFFAVFHAVAVMIASSGLRYWTALAAITPPAQPAPPIAAYAAPGPAPKSFKYRLADHSRWWQIGLELGGALLIWFQFRDFVLSWPGQLRYALIGVFLLPVAHAFTKLFGSVSFTLDGDHLVVQHFPFVFRNRRIRVSDINGIQVNAELDRHGNQSHYSLIVIGLSFEPDRIVYHLSDHEQASELARRIEATIAPARAAVTRASV